MSNFPKNEKKKKNQKAKLKLWIMMMNGGIMTVNQCWNICAHCINKNIISIVKVSDRHFLQQLLCQWASMHNTWNLKSDTTQPLLRLLVSFEFVLLWHIVYRKDIYNAIFWSIRWKWCFLLNESIWVKTIFEGIT